MRTTGDSTLGDVETEVDAEPAVEELLHASVVSASSTLINPCCGGRQRASRLLV